MFYIIGLFLTIAALILVSTNSPVLSDFGPANLLSNAWDTIKDKGNSFLFPRSKNEILIENLDSDYDLLTRFFSEEEDSVINNILSSKDISLKDKKALIEAISAFNSSKDIISDLEANSGDNILKSVIKKIFNLEEKGTPVPTHIPPQCNLVCN